MKKHKHTAAQPEPNQEPKLRTDIPLPEPKKFSSYQAYALACVEYVEAVSWGPIRKCFKGSMWSAFLGPVWPETWTDKPWDTPATQPKGQPGRKPRLERIQEMCDVWQLRSEVREGKRQRSYGEIAGIVDKGKTKKRTPESMELIYKAAVELLTRAQARDFAWIAKRYRELGTVQDLEKWHDRLMVPTEAAPEKPTYLT